ncbi:hypothetical protein HK099_004136 [Clydaea vesicula]|uniref:Protein YAE1 n=1 Tax=Clydaea vesicula TaxID=447962 RepID=A0AAD5Y0G0_9FUNG|nr:hypothetical protein HK099_004136 [Clydaea vesicula]KAJ3386003.1 hypothetical protein HDU92_002763 [Lobulomyces angularis]
MDWLASDEEITENKYDIGIAEKTWDKLHENFGNQGYLEGLEAAKDVRLQEGFDRGFKFGSEIGSKVGLLLGKISTVIYLKKLSMKNDRLSEFQNLLLELQTLKFEAIFTPKQFKQFFEQEENLEIALEKFNCTIKESFMRKFYKIESEFEGLLEQEESCLI